MSPRILIVDDERTAREELAEAVREAGMEVFTAGDGRRGLELSEELAFDICVTDIRMPGMDGIQLLGELRKSSPDTLTIILTAYGALETALAALRIGAVDYLLKPVLFDDLLHKLRRVLDHRDLELQAQSLRRITGTLENGVELVGDSTALRRVKDLIAKVGPTRSNALITGESGTGKELVAQAIHAAGRNAHQPFVPFNCAAIPETMVESELFGHVKGAFTGATSTKEGLLRSAGSGSIFLDEIGDMPPAVQAKLLRALDAREIRPVGSVRRFSFDARLIAATNKDLPEEIAGGSFREDLFYRLAVMEIDVPPLRERKEDLPQLIVHFLAHIGDRLHRRIEGVTPEAQRTLEDHDWPGNVRELANVLERGAIVAEGPRIDRRDLPSNLLRHGGGEGGAGLGGGDPSTTDLKAATRRFQRDYVRRVLDDCGGDKHEAASRLGVSLASLYRKR